MPRRTPHGSTGFTLLPVVLAMSLIGAIAFLLNRDNGFNANLIGAQSDLERARYAAEAGLQAVNYTIQALGCAGSYPILSLPVTDSNFGGAAYSAYANNSSGSPLTLTSIGTYNGASVTLTKTNAYVYQPFLPGITLPWVTQPDSAAGNDADVDQSKPTENDGGSTNLKIRDGQQQTLIAFNLSPLPAGSRIIRWYPLLGGLQPGATISLYLETNDAANNFSVQLITHGWVAGTRTGSVPTLASPGVTWDRWDGLSPNTWPQGPGNGYDPRTLIVVPPPPGAGWIDIDVTDAAVGWTSGVYPNYGVWLVPFTNARNYRFTSSEEATQTTRRPKFTAYYLLPCGATAP